MYILYVVHKRTEFRFTKKWIKIKYWKFVDANEMLKVSRNIEKNLLKVMCFFFMELSVLCAVWSVHFTNFFFDSKVFVAVHYISFAKGKTKRNQFVYIATLCRKQQTHLFDNSCVCVQQVYKAHRQKFRENARLL